MLSSKMCILSMSARLNNKARLGRGALSFIMCTSIPTHTSPKGIVIRATSIDRAEPIPKSHFARRVA